MAPIKFFTSVLVSALAATSVAVPGKLAPGIQLQSVLNFHVDVNNITK